MLRISHSAQTPHIGSALSVVEILATILGTVVPDPLSNLAKLYLSKGHAALALYSSLRSFGFISDGDLESFSTPGSVFEEHPTHLIPGVSNPSGSLGHGLPFAAGMALASRIRGKESFHYVVMSDGECNEGTVWEAAIFCAAKSLKRVVVVVDKNGWQATGRISETFGEVQIGRLFSAAGWDVEEVDGHDIQALRRPLLKHKESPSKPLCIVATTVKGKGVSFMEDDNNWHYRVLSDDDVSLALHEIDE